MWKEFKEFAFKGNVIDLAVAVVIGGAFGKIITSLVEDIIMPLVSIITGSVNFENLNYKINNATLGYGKFIQVAVDFLLISVCIFIVVKIMNKFKKKEAIKKEEPKGPTSEELLVEIRDLLKNKS